MSGTGRSWALADADDWNELRQCDEALIWLLVNLGQSLIYLEPIVCVTLFIYSTNTLLFAAP